MHYVFNMARKPRIHVPGGVYHVMLRGNGGQNIFSSDEDRCHLYLLLQEGTERFGYRVHGFCLMTNHLHLAIQVSDIPLSCGMQNLAFRYTRWVNRREGRVGHLFQGRYKAILVERDTYLLELVRYIHLNPLRAGLVDDPRRYPWSGHCAYIGAETLPWLTTQWVLGQFARRVDTARRRYDAFVREGVGDGHREEFHSGLEDPRILGDDRFAERVLGENGDTGGGRTTLAAVIGVVCREYDLDEDKLSSPGRQRRVSEARAAVGLLAFELGCATLTEVGRRFNRDVGSMSSAVRRLTERMLDSEDLAARLGDLRASVK
jgi:putative transposase